MNALLSVGLASSATGVPTRTIRRWWTAGLLAGEMLGRVLYVDPNDVVRVQDTRGPGGRLPRRDVGYVALAHAIADTPTDRQSNTAVR